MARQIGPLKFLGTIGDLTFYKSQDGYLIKQKSDIPKSRIDTDPNYARTRENNREFTRATKACQLIYSTTRELIANAFDNRLMGRMTKKAIEIIKSDTVNPRGERTISDGQFDLFNGFEFNIHASLSAVINIPITHSINRTTGEMQVIIPPFVPVEHIRSPMEATHYRLVAIGAAFDFPNLSKVAVKADTDHLPLSGTETDPISLTCTLPANSLLPLFLLLGIEFSQEVNSTHYQLKNGCHNALAILQLNA